MAIPIIIVPGIMGTRLMSRGGQPVWDPDVGVPLRGQGALVRLVNTRQVALPYPTAPFLRERLLRQRGVVNGGNLVWNVPLLGDGYKNLVLGLSDPAFSQRCGQRVKVYGAGYDWRQTNADSARVLYRVVMRALRETGAQRVIIIAHSMGGLVTRWFSKYARINGQPGESVIARLILLGSPTHGAAKAYRFLRQSASSADAIEEFYEEESFQDELGDGLLDWSARRFARVFQQFPSVYELLPTQAYCSQYPNWVDFSTARAGVPDASRADRFYRDRWTGVADPTGQLRNRDIFDRGLAGYMPRRTVIVFNNRKSTEARYRIDSEGMLRRGGRGPANLGDGTVPSFSGMAGGIAPGLSRIRFSRLTHGGLANDPGAVTAIKTMIANDCRATRTFTATSRRAITTG